MAEAVGLSNKFNDMTFVRECRLYLSLALSVREFCVDQRIRLNHREKRLHNVINWLRKDNLLRSQFHARMALQALLCPE